MAGHEIFSTVLRGYKKEQVASYIEQMSDQLQELKYDLDRKDVEIDRLNKEVASLRENAEKVDEQQIENQLREKIEAELRTEFDAKLAEQAAQVEKQVTESAKDPEILRKAKEYDECKDALADLMIQARRNADDIVSRANAEAHLIRAKTEAEFSKLNVDFTVLQQNVGNIKGELRRNLDRIADQMDLFEEQLYSLQNDIDHMIDALPSDESEN